MTLDEATEIARILSMQDDYVGGIVDSLQASFPMFEWQALNDKFVDGRLRPPPKTSHDQMQCINPRCAWTGTREECIRFASDVRRNDFCPKCTGLVE